MTTTSNTVPQALFGPGILYLTRNDIANQTPYNVGFCQEFSTDISFDLKELHGQNQLPLVIARGTGKSSGKIKAATLSGGALTTLLFGGMITPTLGTQYDMTSSPSTAIPATPFQITPTVPSSGTFDTDLGVVNAATGEPLILATGTPTAGHYAVNTATGVYTFASADNVSGISVIITFAYKYTGAAGQVLTIANTPIGQTPTFQLDYKTSLYGSTYYVRLFNAVGGKWAMGHKLTDFAMPDYDFGFFPNAAQQLGFIALATQA